MAVLLGALAAAAQPPLHLVFLLPPAFVGLLWLMEGGAPAAPGWKRRARRGFVLGWWFGVGYFAAGLYWVSLSFLVDAERFAWMIPFALFGLSAGLAFYPALVAMLSAAVLPAGPARPLVFAAFWTVGEWVRGWAFTGFPWNPVGNVWAFSDAFLQFAAVGGVYGLSLLTVAAATLPAVLGDVALPARLRKGLVLGACGVVLLLWAGGAWRLSGAADGDVPGVRLRLIQPNVAQRDKWKPELRVAHVRRLLRMSLLARPGPAPTHVIWPETAFPLYLNRRTVRLASLARVVPPGGALITGAPRGSAGGASAGQVWNALHVIDGQGKIVSVYDKHHLVPFGEYVPFRNLLGLVKLTAGRRDFSPGPGPVRLAIPGAPAASPSICYEAIFPGRVTPAGAEANERPRWLLNLTNDAWFGRSSGPYQHFASARLRAVEEGLPMVRVANTGLSGIVDAHGRIRERSTLEVPAIIDGPLPVAIPGGTIYAVGGDVVLLLLICASMAIALSLQLYLVPRIPTYS